MVYLNVLIGFSLIMLVFATGVSIAQTMLTRLLHLKGKVVVGHLLDKLEELWKQADLPPKAYDGVSAALSQHLTTRRGKYSRTLHASAVGNRQVTAAILRRFGTEDLPDLLAGSVPRDKKLDAIWEQIVQGIEHDWDSIASLISASYTASTKRYLLGLSVVVVLLCNMDAIRILRVLAVDPDVRDALVTDATRTAPPQPAQPPGAANAPDAGTVSGSLAQLTDWQQHNVEELKATGLPLGWEVAPLWVCEGDVPATYQKPCSGAFSPGDTVLHWLTSLLGLLLGIGLVSQGAPFWFALLQKELGFKSAAGELAKVISPPASPPQPAQPAGSGQATELPLPPATEPSKTEPSKTEPSTTAPSTTAPSTTEPLATGSVIITDIYSGNGIPSWADFMKSSSFSGVILKATDGVSFSPAKSWFVPQWQAARSAAGARYRQTCFLGAYHWLELYDDPEQQADFYCSIIEQAGWGAGDMLPIIDVEFGPGGKHPAPNYQARVDKDAQRVIDCTSRYAARIKEKLGSDTQVVLYASQIVAELKISDHMGCDYLWVAEYGVSKPDLSTLHSLGWTDQQIVMWQYTDGATGSNKTRSPQLPDNVPGMGPRDCSVFRNGDRYGDLALFKSMLIKR
jgi:GH25 family lysozyme M1 (1,4-beta-N-acetylmuramidase)